MEAGSRYRVRGPAGAVRHPDRHRPAPACAADAMGRVACALRERQSRPGFPGLHRPAGPASSLSFSGFLSRILRAASIVAFLLLILLGFVPQTHANTMQSLTATPGDGQVTLDWTWTKNTGFFSSWQYQVKVGSASYTDWAFLPDQANENKRSHTFTGLTNGTSYTYKMRAFVTGVGLSNQIESNTVTPSTSNITRVSVTSTPTSEPASGTQKVYGAGEKIQITVTFDEAVTVTGDPEFEIKLGNSGQAVAKRAAYESGSGTTALVFEYTVLANDEDDNGIWIEANALKLDADDLIQDSGSNNMTITHAALGGQSDHKVDGTRTPPGTNTAPTATDGEVSTKEDTAYTFAASNFNFSDTDTNDALESVKIASLPGSGKGTLTLDGTAIAANDLPKTVTKDEIDNDKLKYTPPGDANGNDYTTFNFKVNDGDDDSASAYTMTIDVDSVPDVTRVAVTSTPRSGTTPKKYGVGEKIRVTATFDEAVTVTDDPLVQVVVGSNTRNADYASGTGTPALVFEYTVVAEDSDSDGIAVNADVKLDSDSGSEDLVQDSDGNDADVTFTALAAQSAHQVDGTLTPPPANAAPTSSNGEVTTKEDESYTFAAPAFDFSDTDASDALSSVKIVTLPGIGKGTLKLDGTAIASGNLPKTVTRDDLDNDRLTYEPPDDANGNDYTTFTFKVNDGDDDSASAYTMTIDVDPVPDVTGVKLTSTPRSGTANPKDTYGVGETIRFTVTFDEAVDVTGDPHIDVAVGTNTRSATYASGSGSQSLMFEYTVVAEDSDSDGVSIAANSLSLDSNDRIENPGDDGADVTHAALGAQSGHKVDGSLTRPAGAPTLSAAEVDGAELVITFNEDLAAAANLANSAFTVKKTPRGSATAATVVLSSTDAPSISGKTVTLTLDTAVVSTETVTVGYTKPGAGSDNLLKDGDGDEVASFTDQAVANMTAPGDARLQLVQYASDFWLQPEDKVSGRFDVWVRFSPVSSTAITSDDVTIRDTSGVTRGSVSNIRAPQDPRFLGWLFDVTVNEGYEGPLTVTLAADAVPAGNPARSLALDVDQTRPSATLTTEVNQPITYFGRSFRVEVDVSDDVVVDRDLNEVGAFANLFDKTDIVMRPDCRDRSSRPAGRLRSFKGTVSGGDVRATVLMRAPEYEGTMMVCVPAGSFTDRVTNPNTIGVLIVTVDTRRPRVTMIERRTPSSSPTNADTLTWRVTFRENVKNVDAADFEVSGTTGATLAVSQVTATTVYDVTASGGDLAALDATATLSFASAQNIADTAGNALSSTTPTGTNDNSYVVDNTAPTVSSAAADGASLVITFDENLAAAANLANSAFAVTKGSGDDTVALSSTAPSISGATVTLTLASALAHGDTNVEVSYTKPTTGTDNKLKDAADNEVASFSGQAVNTAPTASNNTVETKEDERYTFAHGDFNFADTDSSDALESVKIVTVETAGDLELDGTDVTANQEVTKAELDAGKLIFTPATDGNGASYATFTFKVNDGDDDSASAYTMTIDVDSVPDVTGVAVTSTPRSGTATPPDTYGAGEKIQVTATFDEAVTVTGDPVLGIRMGDSGDTPATKNAAYASGTGTTALVFEYTVQSGDSDDNGIWILENALDLDADDKIEGSDNDAADVTFVAPGGQSDHQVDGSLTPPTDTAPRVTSIERQTPSSSPTNADTLTWRVTFSENVKNVDAADFEVSGTTASLAVSQVTATTVYDVTASGGDLAALDATATLSFASAQNIADTADNALSSTTPTGTNDNSYVVDNTAPTVSSAAADGASLVITFDENLAAAANLANSAFAVTKGSGDDTVALSSTAPSISGATVTLTLASALAHGDTNVEVSYTKPTTGTDNKLKDAADNEVASFSGQAVTNNTNTAPTASNNTVETKEDVAYTFDASDFNFADTDSSDALESVKIVTVETAGDLELDGTDVTANQEVTKAELDAGKLIFTPATDGNGASYATFTFKVNDGDDDSASAYTMTIDVDSVPDVTGVAVTSTPKSGTTPKKYGAGEKIQVTVTFDQAVVVAFDPHVELQVGANTRDADYVSGSLTKALVFEYTVVSGDTDSDGIGVNADVKLDTDVGSEDRIRDGDGYDADVTFTALGAQSAHQVDGSLTPPTDTAPRVTSIERQTPSSSPTNADTLTWRVTFNENVKNVDAADFEVGGTTASLAVSQVTATTVYDVTASGGDLAALDATATLSFASAQNIADTADNALSSTAPTGTNDNSYVVDNTAPTVAAAAVTHWKVVDMTFTEDLDSTSAPAAGAFTVNVGSGTRPVSSVGVAGDRSVTLTMAEAFIAGETVTVDYAKPGTNPLKDAAGNEVANFSGRAVSNNAPACPGGQPASAFWTACLTVGKDAFGIYGYESGANTGALSDDTFTLKGDDTQVTALTYSSGLGLQLVVSYRFRSTDLVLQVGSTSLNLPSGTSQYVWASPGFTWDDANLGDKVSVSLRLKSDADTTAPTLRSATVDGAELVLTYDETLYRSAATIDATAFTVKVNGTAQDLADPVDAAPVTHDGAAITLTLASAVAPSDTVTVTYVRPSSGEMIRDLSGNRAAAFADREVSAYRPPETGRLPPEVHSAEVDGTSLVVTFDQHLAAAASLANGAFEVKKRPSGGSEQTVTLSGSPSISGATVTLTLDTAVTGTDTGVTVSYTRPGSGSGNKLQNLTGHEVVSFAGRAVANALRWSGTPVLEVEVKEGERATFQWTPPGTPTAEKPMELLLIQLYGSGPAIDITTSSQTLTSKTAGTFVLYGVEDDDWEDEVVHLVVAAKPEGGLPGRIGYVNVTVRDDDKGGGGCASAPSGNFWTACMRVGQRPDDTSHRGYQVVSRDPNHGFGSLSNTTVSKGGTHTIDGIVDWPSGSGRSLRVSFTADPRPASDSWVLKLGGKSFNLSDTTRYWTPRRGIVLAVNSQTYVFGTSSLGWGEGDKVRVSLFDIPKPTSPSSAPGDKQATLTWTAPSGVTVTDYEVRLCEGTAARCIPRHYLSQTTPRGYVWYGDASSTGSTTASHTVTGRENGVTYTWQVRAVTANGKGGWSDAAEFTPTGNNQVLQPAAPRITGVTPGGLEATLEWRMTEAVEGITGWQVRYGEFDRNTVSVDDWGEWTDLAGAGGDARSYTVTGLSAGTDYGVELRAMVGTLAGAASPMNLISGVLLALSGLAAAPDEGAVALSWTAPSFTDDISYWQVRWKAADAAAWGDWTDIAGATAASTAHTVTGLDNGTRYALRVRAIAINGEPLAESAAVEAWAGGPPAPGAPALLAEAGVGRVTLTWTAPESVEPITGWQLRHGPTGAEEGETASEDAEPEWGEWTAIEDATAATAEHTVTGLENGAEYAFELRALAGALVGEASVRRLARPDEEAIPPFVDSAVSSVTATTVGLEWTLPEMPEGMAATRLRAMQREKGATGEWQAWQDAAELAVDATSTTVTGLAPATLYQFRIVVETARQSTDSGLLQQETLAADMLDTRMTGTVPDTDDGTLREGTPAQGCRVDVAVRFLDADGNAVAVNALAATDFAVENGRIGTPVADADGLSWTVPARATTNERGLVRVRLPATERWRAAEQVFHNRGAGVCVPAARGELADLRVEEISISPGFSSTATSYTGETTDADAEVLAEPVYADATVTVAPADADEEADGHQVALAEGETEVTVTVTPGDGSAAQTYTVTVTREAAVTDTGVLTGFVLVDAATDTDLGAIADGGTVSVSAAGRYGIRAETQAGAEVGSVVLTLAGPGADDVHEQTESIAPWSLYGDAGGAEHGRALAAGSYTLTATAHAERGGAGRALGALTVAFTAAASTATLTATLENLPERHDGATAFSFELRLSEHVPVLSYKTVRDAAFTVTGGEVTDVRRLAPQAVDRNRRWEITVEPDSIGEVAVTLPATTDCAAAGAVCHADGRMLSAPASATVPGPALSVADAQAEEGTDATLDFAVTLVPARTAAVTVEYATSDDTATAGSDYTATSGTLTFAAGETEKTVSVPVLDDDTDEGSETLTLRLSSAEGANIADGEATGTITNSDAIPKAWLARFGRTVTGQVLDAVEARLAAPRAAGAEASLAGQALPSWRGDARAANDNASAGSFPAEAEDRAALAAMTAWLAQTGSEGRGTAGLGAYGDDGGLEPQSHALTQRDLILGTSFTLTGGSAEGGGFASLWGRGSIAGFDGRERSLTVDGEVTTGLLGADFASERWRAGLGVGHSTGTGGWRRGGACEVNCGGGIEATLSGVYPYAGVDLTERLSVWAAAGRGWGEVTVTPEGEAGLTADLAMSMGAAGMRGEVLRPESGDGLVLALKGDARFTRTSSDAVRSDAGNLEAADADVWLVRAGIEGSRRFGLGTRDGKASVTPSFELGLRRDGGDAESGMGADLGGGLALADPGHGLAFDARARALVAHQAKGFREWGASLSGSWDPRPSTDRGLSLTLTRSWGAAPSGGMDALLSHETLAGLAPAGGEDGSDGFRASRRLEGELGYGLGVFGGAFTGTPNLGLGLSESAREWRIGWRLAPAGASAVGFEVGLDATRSERTGGDAAPEHGVMLRGALRW